MMISYLVATIMATAVVASPLVYSAPVTGHGTQVAKFKSNNNVVGGCFGEGYAWACFYASAYDDFNGVRQGNIEVWLYDLSTYILYDIYCSGPAYANVVSVDKINGNSSINATLNPASSDCYDYFVTVSQAVTLNVSGQYNGKYRNSLNGTGKEADGGVNYKFNFQYDTFGETFTGTNGFYSGTFTGSASSEHRTDRQQVK